MISPLDVNNNTIIVDKITRKETDIVEFDTLATGDEKKLTLKLGTPFLKTKVKGQILADLKGDKIRVARFKAKSRYRKVIGFRPHLSKVKIITI